MNVDPWESRLNFLARNADDWQWALAKFARESRDEGVAGWAERIGAHPLVRRSKWTVMHWAQAAEVWEAYPAWQGKLPFSAWEVLAAYAEALPNSAMATTLEQVLDDGALTVAELKARLYEQFGEDGGQDERAPYPVWTLGSDTVRRLLAEQPDTPVVILAGWADVQHVRVTAARERQP